MISWKTLDPRGELLTIIYSVCRNREQIPDSWKISITVLACEKNKGYRLNLANWRPICLQNPVYKLYVGTIAKRIATWAINMNTINNAQEGSLPYEGCFEHNFVLQSYLQDVRKKQKEGAHCNSRPEKCIRISTN